ncbi:MAG: fused MFS/spermidine synthase [Rubrobacter sp.]|nr:fused MFS/spermidine synthase [Rubrobacter sp.]MDQ3638209.1 fused MFS/spermidine synthase [Actinomycetota bacterium]
MSAQGIKIDKKDAARKGSPSNASLMILFSVTIFVSAALLFLVEPMFAKFVLPSFGGTPAVWTGSMMFFQAALLTSYLYVHATTTWLGARKQAVLHLVLVLLPLLVLPLAVPADEWAPSSEGNPIFLLLGLLAVTVGLPFFAISATNPLIQRWLADTDHPAARDPYFLYRASNLGSVIGLLGYPLVVERELTLANQGIWWSIGYGLLILLVFASAVMLWRSTPANATEREEEAEPLAGDPVSGGGSSQTADPSLEGSRAEGLTLLRRLRWVGLTFIPSSLMLGVTAFLTTDITPVPLLWVIPLSLYLFSFVVVFSPSQRMPDLIHKIMVGAMPVIMTTLVLTTVTDLRRPYWALILLHLIGFFVVAMVLHGEVARDRPPARHLTEFYLWVAVGGVLGGVFNALIAPVAFDTVVEYPLVIILACLFVPGLVLSRLLRRRSERERDTRSREGEEAPPGGDEEERETLTSSGSTGGSRSRRQELALDLALPVALGLGILALGWVVDSGYFDSLFSRSTVWQLFIGLAAAVCLWFAYSSSRPIRFGLGIAALVVAVSFANGAGNVLFEDRSFFGVYRVTGDAGTENAYHALVVGDTNHGAQLLGPQPPTPIAYHDPSGPFGQLFDLLPGESTDESPISVLGLGAGVMSCYSEPGQQWTYYEIDPAVEAIARTENLFTYLRDCPGEYDVVLGDARLKLAEAEPGSYGMIIGEAFSSDAIPVHMLTREATDMYFEKLNENGVLVHHISNRHLELEPVVGDLARDRGLTCYASYDDLSNTQPSATSQYKLAAHFTVLARDEADLGSVPDDPRWAPCQTNAETDKVWTDDYSNLLSTFAFQ